MLPFQHFVYSIYFVSRYKIKSTMIQTNYLSPFIAKLIRIRCTIKSILINILIFKKDNKYKYKNINRMLVGKVPDAPITI